MADTERKSYKPGPRIPDVGLVDAGEPSGTEEEKKQQVEEAKAELVELAAMVTEAEKLIEQDNLRDALPLIAKLFQISARSLLERSGQIDTMYLHGKGPMGLNYRNNEVSRLKDEARELLKSVPKYIRLGKDQKKSKTAE